MNPLHDPFFIVGAILCVVTIILRWRIDHVRDTSTWHGLLTAGVITAIASLASPITAIIRAAP